MPNYKGGMIRDLFETFGANAFLIALGCLTSVIIARILGPEMRGELAVILLWSGIFATLTSLGINESLGYFAGIKGTEKWKYLYTSLILSALTTLVLLIPSVFSVPVLMGNYSKRVIHLGMLSVGFYSLVVPQFMSAQSFLQGSGLIRQLNLLNLLNAFLYFFFVLIIWMFFPRGHHDLGLTVGAYIGTFSILSFVSFALLTHLRRNEYGSLKRVFSAFGYSEGKHLIKYGAPVTIANLVNQASTKLDQIFLALLVSPALMGFYAVALTTSAGISVSGLTVSTIVLPRITNASNIEERKFIIRNLFLSYYLSSIPIFLLTFATLPFLIPILFGPAFAGSINASRIFLAGSIFVGANQLCVAIFKALGLPNYAMACRALTLALLAFCLSLLVPRYNIVGAALAVVISNSMTSLITICLIAKRNGMKLSQILFPKWEDLKALKEGILKYHFNLPLDSAPVRQSLKNINSVFR